MSFFGGICLDPDIAPALPGAVGLSAHYGNWLIQIDVWRLRYVSPRAEGVMIVFDRPVCRWAALQRTCGQDAPCACWASPPLAFQPEWAGARSRHWLSARAPRL